MGEKLKITQEQMQNLLKVIEKDRQILEMFLAGECLSNRMSKIEYAVFCLRHGLRMSPKIVDIPRTYKEMSFGAIKAELESKYKNVNLEIEKYFAIYSLALEKVVKNLSTLNSHGRNISSDGIKL